MVPIIPFAVNSTSSLGRLSSLISEDMSKVSIWLLQSKARMPGLRNYSNHRNPGPFVLMPHLLFLFLQTGLHHLTIKLSFDGRLSTLDGVSST